mmetsp:Transcript_46432/g.148243  ORF Transcript_46432/g.148243 Transcript_46432/m.148243 type:complete len:494 (+) Transcript_46432:888-2369(+)
MEEAHWHVDQYRLDVYGVLDEGDADCDHGMLARDCSGPRKHHRPCTDVYNGLPLDLVGGIDHVVVLVANNHVERVLLWRLRGQVGLHGKRVGANSQRLGQSQLQGEVDAVWLAAWQADLLQGALPGASEEDAGGRHDGDLGAAGRVHGEGDGHLCRLQVRHARVGHSGARHLRDREALAFTPARGGAGALPPALDEPGPAVRRMLRRLHPDADALELRQQHASWRGDRRRPPARGAQGLPRHAVVAAALLVEGEAGRGDDHELPHHGAALVDVERDLDDGPRGRPVPHDPERHLLNRVEAAGLAIVRVRGVLLANARVEAPVVRARLGDDPHDDGVGRVGLQGHFCGWPPRLQRGLKRPVGIQLHGGLHLASADDHKRRGLQRVGARALASDDQLLCSRHLLREGEAELGLRRLKDPRLEERLDREHGARLPVLALKLRSPLHCDPPRQPEAICELKPLVHFLAQGLVAVGDEVEFRLAASASQHHRVYPYLH